MYVCISYHWEFLKFRLLTFLNHLLFSYDDHHWTDPIARRRADHSFGKLAAYGVEESRERRLLETATPTL